MKFQTLLLPLALVSAISLGAYSMNRSAVSCRPPDTRSAGTISELQALATSTAPADIALRDSLKLNIRRTSDVALISTEATCFRGATELDKLWKTGTTNRQVFVYKVGQDFGVEDPQSAGDYRGVAFFTSKWVYKSLLVGP
jgi:hypothetical protein